MVTVADNQRGKNPPQKKSYGPYMILLGLVVLITIQFHCLEKASYA